MMAQARDRQFASSRQALFGLAYRLLGTVQDAEDVVHETWLRWRAVADTVEHPEAYLRRIASNLSLDLLRQRQRISYTGPWLPEPALDEPDPATDPAHGHQQREAVSLAFLHMLEQLNPVERAVFVLREAFDCAFGEIALCVARSPDNCRQIFSRARRKLQQAPARREATPPEHDRLLMSFLWACQQGDVAALQQLLARDAVLYSDGGGQVMAALRPIYGAGKVIRLMLALTRKQPPGLEFQMRTVNGRMALVATRDGQTQQVFTLCTSADGIEAVYIVLNPDKLGRAAPQAKAGVRTPGQP